MRIDRLVGTSVVFAVGALGQSAQSPAFEVASVKAAPPVSANKGAALGGDAGRLDWTNVSLRQMIALAYQLKEYQISGPDWLATTRFDLQAKLPNGAAPSEKWPMLQALLAERFKVAVHRDRKELEVYALATGKSGPKLKEADETSADAGKMLMRFGQLEVQGQRMADFVEVLSRMMDRPVVDATGLTGKYDITLHWTPEAHDGSIAGMKIGMARDAGQKVELPPSQGPNLFLAVQQQLGLKLDPKKLPVEILVVDRADKVPVEN